MSIDLPDGWKPQPNHRGYYINLGNNTGVTLIFGEDDPACPPLRKVAGFAQVFSRDPYHDPPSFKATVIDPFQCGMHTGARVDRDFGDHKGTYAGLVVNDTYVFAQTLGLSDEDNELAWKAIGSLQLKAGLQEALHARLATLLEAGPEEEPQRLNATDLSRIRTKRFTTWMDHSMALLMDSESYPEDVPTFDEDSQAKLVVPCSDRAMWLMSLTEFDVKLEFIVRATVPRPRKVWWQRECEAAISVPTGVLQLEQTTGGTMLEIELRPGDYRMIARASCTKDSDPLAESGEMIQVTLVPMGTG
jgi:hypothetical protein